MKGHRKDLTILLQRETFSFAEQPFAPKSLRGYKVAMGQDPIPPVNIPIPTKMGGINCAPTKQNGISLVLTHSQVTPKWAHHSRAHHSKPLAWSPCTARPLAKAKGADLGWARPFTRQCRCCPHTREHIYIYVYIYMYVIHIVDR